MAGIVARRQLPEPLLQEEASLATTAMTMALAIGTPAECRLQEDAILVVAKEA